MAKVIKDPFNAPDSAPQIPAVYQYPKPPDLRNFDDAKGGIHQAIEQIDPHSDSFFTPEKEHTKEYDFDKRRRT
jgi:hypothetical protein